MCDERSESPSVWSEKWRTSKKTHRCRVCGETIQPGHRYHYLSGIWDGRPDEFKHCARCWEIFSCLIAETDADAVQLDLDCGEVWNDPPENVAALAFMIPSEAQAELVPR